MTDLDSITTRLLSSRINRRWPAIFASLFAPVFVAANLTVAGAQGLTGDLRVHDPSTVIEQDGTYHVFYTRNGVGRKSSTDLVHWDDNRSLVFSFDDVPDWHEELVPENSGNLWAPDVAYFNNRYHVYYSVSSFGSQTSAIGLATSPTLDPSDPDHAWTDMGPVVTSGPGETPFNAIDPAIIRDSGGAMFLSWGSYWDGIYMSRIDEETGLPGGRGNRPRHIAGRAPGQGTAIEAPYIYERHDSYYLFVNWGTCCDGVDSTYNIRVGRSESVTGPYVDRDGVRLERGGGSLFLESEDRFIGPGHASIVTSEGVDWFGYHYYDGSDRGASKYNLRTVYWDDGGWPVLGDSAPVPGDYNSDGVVNAADYVVWRNLEGTQATLPGRNGSLSGPIGVGDYEYWLANFGRTFRESRRGAAAHIPEPSTTCLLSACLTTLLISRCGARSQIRSSASRS